MLDPCLRTLQMTQSVRQTFHSHCHAWCWSGSQKEYAKQAGDTVCIDGGDVFNVWYAAQVQRIHGTWKHGPGPESGPSRLSQQRVKVVGALFSGVPIPTIPAGPVHLAYLSRCKAPGGQDTLPGVPGSSPLPDVHSTWPLIGHVKVYVESEAKGAACFPARQSIFGRKEKRSGIHKSACPLPPAILIPPHDPSPSTQQEKIVCIASSIPLNLPRILNINAGYLTLLCRLAGERINCQPSSDRADWNSLTPTSPCFLPFRHQIT
ncbi:uncharacterized protein BDZ83DRAFT_197549 [Colletotrichum acutatum]|uniref:Uncharacterized protein n=1 Tax=Glomerella acutata TaxID=27357 RepID=A0AAD8UNH4_GLOAC|nr:uncharacterized protein BDZ83DRAFT_197549 [Colletotrichum acutatum]KAK1727622.1 hypothetical protein BDZ83DRAFT_197549 [Colletotrichum acutatum]